MFDAAKLEAHEDVGGEMARIQATVPWDTVSESDEPPAAWPCTTARDRVRSPRAAPSAAQG